MYAGAYASLTPEDGDSQMLYLPLNLYIHESDMHVKPRIMAESISMLIQSSFSGRRNCRLHGQRALRALSLLQVIGFTVSLYGLTNIPATA